MANEQDILTNEQESPTMKERIEAFYRQSGGPNNPDIQRIIEEHLLYGKDHGVRGKRETIRDAFRRVISNDPSNKLVYEWITQFRASLNDHWEELVHRQDGQTERMMREFAQVVNKRLAEQDRRLAQLEAKLDQILQQLDGNSDASKIKHLKI